MIRAALFDLGGVLVDVEMERCWAALAVGTPLAPAEVARRVMAAYAATGYDVGAVAPARFAEAVGEALAAPRPLDAFEAAWCGVFAERSATVALLGRLARRGAPLYLLSNTDPLHLARVRRDYRWLSWFRGAHLSYEAGARKPDEAYFLGALSRLGLEPAACLFWDDRPENVEGARRVGLGASLYRSAEALEEELCDRGLL